MLQQPQTFWEEQAKEFHEKTLRSTAPGRQLAIQLVANNFGAIWRAASTWQMVSNSLHFVLEGVYVRPRVGKDRETGRTRIESGENRRTDEILAEQTEKARRRLGFLQNR